MKWKNQFNLIKKSWQKKAFSRLCKVVMQILRFLDVFFVGKLFIIDS